MKTLISMSLIVVMLSLSMMSCMSESETVDNYFYESALFECKVVSLKEATYNDSSRQHVDVFYVFAKDVWDAQRLFEPKLTEVRNTLNGSEVYWNMVPIAERQEYPYE